MGWASVRVEPEMQRMLDLIDVDDVAKTIRSELAELFPGTRFEVEAKKGVFSGYVAVKWTDGPALTRVQETGIRERHDLILVNERTGGKARTGSLFVKYERSYSEEALETAKCISPYMSYDYALLSETDFEGKHEPEEGA